MTRTEADDLVARYHDALNSHNLAALMPFYAQDAVVVSPMFRTLHGRAAIQASFENLFHLAPDYRVQPNDSLFEGDRAAEISTALPPMRPSTSPSGHAATHAPQPMHFSGSILG